MKSSFDRMSFSKELFSLKKIHQKLCLGYNYPDSVEKVFKFQKYEGVAPHILE